MKLTNLNELIPAGIRDLHILEGQIGSSDFSIRLGLKTKSLVQYGKEIPSITMLFWR